VETLTTRPRHPGFVNPLAEPIHKTRFSKKVKKNDEIKWREKMAGKRGGKKHTVSSPRKNRQRKESHPM
jgi:hypothetical protein